MKRRSLKSALLLTLWLCWFNLQIVATAGAGGPKPFHQGERLRSGEVEIITAEELKAKVIRNEPVTILDVRATSSYVDSDNTIKGSVHVKLRRLKSRLAFPPLRNVPRDSEVVTYCACPADESSIRAAQILEEAGFKRVRVLKGGWRMWLKVNGPVTPK